MKMKMLDTADKIVKTAKSGAVMHPSRWAAATAVSYTHLFSSHRCNLYFFPPRDKMRKNKLGGLHV